MLPDRNSRSFTKEEACHQTLVFAETQLKNKFLNNKRTLHIQFFYLVQYHLNIKVKKKYKGKIKISSGICPQKRTTKSQH